MMFKLVSQMNEAFGNQKGNPNVINGKKLVSQCKNIASEFQELMKPLGFDVAFQFTPITVSGYQGQMDDIRDALCDIMVFALGAHHIMGYDAERDMQSVIDGVMTRFCKDSLEMAVTIEKYKALGVSLYPDGQFPKLCLKSTHDQVGTDGDTYPKDKFVKSVGYRKPIFYKPEDETPIDIIAEMNKLRDTHMSTDEAKYLLINRICDAVRTGLEQGIFGFPEYNSNKNNSGDFTPPV
jgi:hypothetical protein